MASPTPTRPTGILAIIGLLTAVCSTELTAQDKLLDKALQQAIEAAQKKLEKTAKLWEDHSTWRKARVVKSKYFALRTTQSYVYGKALCQGLDTMAEHFKKLLKPDFNWTDKTQILLYPDIPAYNSAGSNSDTHSSVYGSFLAPSNTGGSVAAAFKSNYDMVCIEVTHSAVHQFMNRAYPGNQGPTWLQEGLASYFALYWNKDWGPAELSRFQKQKTWVPLSSVLRRTLATYGNADVAHYHFMELGVLFNYLLHWKPETRSSYDDKGVQQGPFADYLRKTLQGIDVKRHPVHELLFSKTAELEAELKSFKFK